MDILTINTLSMMYELKSICESYKDIWCSNIDFSDSYDKFLNKLNNLDANADNDFPETKKFIEEKAKRKNVLIETTYYISSRLLSFALTVENKTVFDAINLRYSDLVSSRTGLLISKSYLILEYGNKYLQKLGNYGVTEENIKDLVKALNDYKEISSQSTTVSPKNAEKKQISESFKNHLKEISEILKEKLDKDIENFRILKADFYERYNCARSLADVISSTISLKGNVVDNKTFKAISNVSVTVLELKIVKKTSVFGNYKFQILPPGNYSLRFYKYGYIEKNYSVDVNSGETTVIDVQMISKI